MTTLPDDPAIDLWLERDTTGSFTGQLVLRLHLHTLLRLLVEGDRDTPGRVLSAIARFVIEHQPDAPDSARLRFPLRPPD